MSTQARTSTTIQTGKAPWTKLAWTAAVAFGVWMAWSVLEQRPTRPTVAVVADTPQKSNSQLELALAWEQELLKSAQRRSAASGIQAHVEPLINATRGSSAQTKEERELEAAYASFDEGLKPATALPAWAASRDLHAQVMGADGTATLSGLACAEHVCRFTVSSMAGDPQQEFVERLSGSLADDGTSVMYRYSADTRTTLVYLLHSDESAPSDDRARQ
jgi:hypothetical protein